MIVYLTSGAHQSLPLTREVASPNGEDGGRENVGFSVLLGQIRNFKVFSPSVSFADSPLVRGGLGDTERHDKLKFETENAAGNELNQ